MLLSQKEAIVERDVSVSRHYELNCVRMELDIR